MTSLVPPDFLSTNKPQQLPLYVPGHMAFRKGSGIAWQARIYKGWFSRPLKSLGFSRTKKRWHRINDAMYQSTVWYNMSRMVAKFLVVALIACTVLDILPQSFKSGQYWNSIIVIIAVCIVAVWSFIIRIARQIDLRRSMRRIPRYYQLGERDMPKSMHKRILSEKERCHELFRTQTDFRAVQHPGLQSAQRMREEWSVEVPFWELVETIPVFLENSLVQVIPDLRRPAGAGLRGYLAMALDHGAIEESYSGDVEALIVAYEAARFSKHVLSEVELLALMQAVFRVAQGIRHRDDLGDFGEYQDNSPPLQLRKTNTLGSVRTFASLRLPDAYTSAGSMPFTD